LPTDAEVEAHRRSIIQWLLKCHIPERDSEDIAQAVIFGAIRAIQSGRYVPMSKLTTWLYKIALNHAHVYHNSARVRHEKLIDPLLHVDSCSPSDPEQSLLARLDIDVLRELEPRHREVLEAVVDETTPSEYAAHNGLRLSTVYGRLLQARASYRAALARKAIRGT
jgi:RNA polymerase sigma factor (sigma-70 family)